MGAHFQLIHIYSHAPLVILGPQNCLLLSSEWLYSCAKVPIFFWATRGSRGLRAYWVLEDEALRLLFHYKCRGENQVLQQHMTADSCRAPFLRSACE